MSRGDAQRGYSSLCNRLAVLCRTGVAPLPFATTAVRRPKYYIHIVKVSRPREKGPERDGLQTSDAKINPRRQIWGNFGARFAGVGAIKIYVVLSGRFPAAIAMTRRLTGSLEGPVPANNHMQRVPPASLPQQKSPAPTPRVAKKKTKG